MKNQSVKSKLFMPVIAALFAAGAAFATNKQPVAEGQNLATFWEEQSASSCSELECSEDNSGIACKQANEIHSNASCNQVANVSALRRP